MELELGELYPRIGGLSGTLSTNVVRCLLNRSIVSHFRMCSGLQFHILGPMIANEFSMRLLCLILQPLCRGGTLAIVLWRLLSTKVICRSLDVRP